MKYLSIIFCFVGFLASAASANVDESQIDLCAQDADCIVVPYRHCCGSTKRAIHQRYKKLYESTPAWQRFDDPEKCAVMGKCPPDENLTTATCRGTPVKRCQLFE